MQKLTQEDARYQCDLLEKIWDALNIAIADLKNRGLSVDAEIYASLRSTKTLITLCKTHPKLSELTPQEIDSYPGLCVGCCGQDVVTRVKCELRTIDDRIVIQATNALGNEYALILQQRTVKAWEPFIEKKLKQSLAVTDNRTGKQYEIPIENGTIRAPDLRQIKTSADDFGLMTYDPSFMNTASCKSKITFIDGEKGILQYRGYPIEQLAENCTYLEVAYLLLNGELPTKSQLEQWVNDVTHHTMIHENIKKVMDAFHYDAHPMGMLVSTLGALSTFYPDAKDIFNADSRRKQALRLVAKMPTLAAFAYRHSLGQPYAYPDNDLSYTENFLNMLFKGTELKYNPDPALAKALDVLFILHADHEQNCSAHAMRVIGSSRPDPYSALAGASAALYGPLHGGANEAVVKMLTEIGSVEKVPAVIQQVREGKKLLMGFGHRVYKSYDPRAKIVKQIADKVFEVTGKNPLLDIALELERIALSDEYFIKRKLYPNVDFYSGLIYQAMRFPPSMYTVLFAIPRTSGWIAQWEEGILDPEQGITRPRQVYAGEGRREFLPMEKRLTHTHIHVMG
jgi:citrate synthase